MAITRVQSATDPTGTPLTSGTTLALATPATAGNLLVATWAIDKDAGTFTGPAGWTVLANQTGASVSLLVAYKIAVGGDAAPTATWTTARAVNSLLVEYAGADPADPIGPSDLPAYSDTAVTSMAFGTVAATRPGAALAVFAWDSFSTAGDSTDVRPAATGFTWSETSVHPSVASVPPIAVCHDVSVAPGDSLAPTFTWTNSDQAVGFLFLVNEPQPRTNSFEGGTNGATITTANSGGASGDAWSLAQAGTLASLTYSDAQAMHGGKSAKLVVQVAASSGQTNAQLVYSYATSTPTSLASRFYIRFDGSMPTNVQSVFAVYLAGSGSAHTYINANGTIRVDDIAGPKFTTPSGTPLVADKWYRLEHVYICGATTTTGSMQFALYDGDATTPLFSYSNAALDVGTAQTFANIQFGRPASLANANGIVGWYVDDVAVLEGATTFLGPAPAAPTVNRLRLGAGTVTLRLGSGAVAAAHLGATKIYP